jgi:glycerophosphoryl diester phosphodiesterase
MAKAFGMHVKRYLVTILVVAAAAVHAGPPAIFFQAHRGGLDEVPENTLPALDHAWGISGAVPEVDIQTTQDGVMVILHDATPKRTTNTPAAWADTPIRDIPYAEIQTWDAGAWFSPAYAGTPVPTLEAVLAKLKESPERQLYLDLKGVDTEKLITLLKAEKVTDRVIFVHGSPAECLKLSRAWPGARTMTWLSGEPERIKTRFRELAQGGFAGISQIQLHLKPRAEGAPGDYELDWAFLDEAVKTATNAGVTLQVRPFVFDPPALRALIDLGIHWYVADAPAALRTALDKALAL